MFDVLSMLENTVGAFENALSLVANRASNTSTAGYKEPEYAFSTLFTQQFYGSSAVGNGIGNAQGMSAQNTGSGSQLLLMGHSMRQGDRRQGTQTDAIIFGSGFFVTQSAQDQNRTLTRDGRFRIDSAGYLIHTSTGARVQGHALEVVPGETPTGTGVDAHYARNQHRHAAGGLVDIRLTAPANATPEELDAFSATQIGITDDGYIYSAYGNLFPQPSATGGTGSTAATDNIPGIDGQIGTARFQLAIGSVSNPSALSVVGNGNAFQTSLASGEINIVSDAAAAAGNSANLGGNVVGGGAFEASNVEIGRLLVEGVQIQRSYNAVQSVLGMVAKFMSNFFSTVDKVAA